jgi:putative membrane protein
MNVNMAAAFLLLALFFFKGLGQPDRQRWVPAFFMSGLISLAFGLHMSFTWPMPSVYNIAFGELSVLLGAILIGGAWALNRNADLMPISAYAFVAGIAPVFVGITFITQGISSEPVLTGLGVIGAGAVGILAFPMAYFYERNPGLSRSLQLLMALLALVLTFFFAYSGYTGYADHLGSESFQGWRPSYAR